MKQKVEAYLKADPIELMQLHAKSFSFASLFFNKETLASVARLYQVCRFIDDVADTLDKADALEILIHLKRSLQNLEPCRYEGLLDFIDDNQIARDELIDLVDGALFDLEDRQIQSTSELIDYCYHVAGVVGLMMCPLIGVKEKDARNGAVDLGIGMQLVNISRDILEDARLRRTYLPNDLLYDNNLSIDDLSIEGKTPVSLKFLLKNQIELADHYFRSGFDSLGHIPLRSRFVILFAGKIYQRIGYKITKSNFEVLKERIFVSTLEKTWMLCRSLSELFKKSFWKPRKETYSTLYPKLESIKTQKIKAIL